MVLGTLRQNASRDSVHCPCPQWSRTLIPWLTEPASTWNSQIVQTEKNPEDKNETWMRIKGENGLGTLENRLGELLGFWWWWLVSCSSWCGVSNLGSDLRFLRTKKPARVAERKIKISLRGHISLSQSQTYTEKRERKRDDWQMSSFCGRDEKRGSGKGAVEDWSILVMEMRSWLNYSSLIWNFGSKPWDNCIRPNSSTHKYTCLNFIFQLFF